jgi:hypothetical protein
MKKSQLRKLIKEEIREVLNENSFEEFRDTDEMGWMEVTMEEIAHEQDLDLQYRSDFNIAFNKALIKLKKDQPQLNFNLIQKFKEKMF